MTGFSEPLEEFVLDDTLGMPLTARALSVICKALADDVVSGDEELLVETNLAGNGLRFTRRAFKREIGDGAFKITTIDTKGAGK